MLMVDDTANGDVVEKKEGSLVDKVDRILEYVEERDEPQKGHKRRKEKAFRLPFGVRMQERRIAKKQKLLVFLVSTNRGLNVVVRDVIDKAIWLDKHTPRDINMDDVFLWKGRVPAVIIPEWSMTPLSSKNYDRGDADKAAAETAMIRHMESAAGGALKKALGGKALIWIVLVVGAVIYIFMQ